MEIQITKDGSHTLVSKEFGELYHSHNGSIQEALHIFIKHGLEANSSKSINIFEMGFGSGLNAILSYYYSKSNKVQVNYSSIEAYPIKTEIAKQLNYNDYIKEEEFDKDFNKLHLVKWDEEIKISNTFSLFKIHNTIETLDIETLDKVDIIFYDAFAPTAQLHLWEKDVLTKMYNLLKPGGFLITYCAKGVFKRTLKEIGFTIEALPGPIGKREITRAFRTN
ncbi:MAG: tRNA U34 5-methylaminomethyl-2-thiouridine-forming methyltransferase MnmC [Planctomycetota bacterium]|jgi:tRNA U34 5-methylaminomethyl-2-thiouridine-forming methyltransferase MnmC